MLTKLLPEQVAERWDVIKYAVEESLPPIVGDHLDKINRVLAAALSGKIDVWVSYRRLDNGIKFESIVLTQFLHDEVSNTRNLLIYCLYGYVDIDKRSWDEGLNTLARYAKSRHCSRIIAYSSLPYIINLSNTLGADTDYTFISFDVNKIVQNLNDLDGVQNEDNN